GFHPDGHLTVDDSADTVGRTVTLNVVNGAGTITGLALFATISFSEDVDVLTINGGAGGNTFNILDTPHETFLDNHLPATFINSGWGADTVNVLHTSSTALDINGQGGRDKVSLGNNGNAQGILSVVRITNQASFTAVTVDDSTDSVARTV